MFARWLGCAALALAVPWILAQGAQEEEPELLFSPTTVIGRVLDDDNTRNKSDEIPERWYIDLDGDGGSDLRINDRTNTPLSELVDTGTVVEAVIHPVNRRLEEYVLVHWVRIGGSLVR